MSLPEIPAPPAVADEGRPRSRRALVTGLATAGLAVAAAAPAAEAEAATDPVLHLLRRATFGATPALAASVRASGTASWLSAQLAPRTIADPVVDELMTRWPGRAWRPAEVRAKLTPAERWDFMYGTVERQMARALWSRRQLFEVVVDFWTNHLVVPCPHPEVHESAHLYQQEVIRQHALGRYADLLPAAVRHPALLRVLDLANSTRLRPNENHARELLELHSVGVGQHTEADVRGAARALTGLGVDPDTGEYRYRAADHWVGPVAVLGWSHPNPSPEGGEQVALSLLTYLARHPATARRIATKLAVRFVADAPPATLVEKLAAVYLAEDTAITPVLRALFTSTEFAAAAGQKIRTPYEDAMATLRLVRVKPEPSGTAGLHALIWPVRQLGQLPMGWQAPNGYPDVGAAWATTSATLRRWNFHVGAVAGWSAGLLPRLAPRALLPRTLPATYGGLVDALARRFLVTPFTRAQRTALCTYLQHAPGDPLRATDPAVGWRLPHVAALVLDSPNFTLR